MIKLALFQDVETVTHQKSGIINLLFFLFLSPYRISPATFTLNTKSSSRNLHAIFLVQISLATPAFWKKYLLLLSIFHLLALLHASPFTVPNSTGLILLQQLKTGVFFLPMLDSHLASLFFTREASGLSGASASEKVQQFASGWRALLTSATTEKQ